MAYYKEKIYECCICKRLLKNVNTCKIVKWAYNTKGESKFEQEYMRHFCKRCISKIDNWIEKHSEEKL